MARIRPPQQGDARGEVTRVYRRVSQAGLPYSETLIHETKQSDLKFLAWYIRHKNGPARLAGKLVRRQGPPNVDRGQWAEREFSLSEGEVEALRRALREHSAVATEGPTEGELLILRAEGETTAASGAEPGEVVRVVFKLLERRDVLASFAREDLAEEIIGALQLSVRVQELRQAVDDLRRHLDSGDVLEQVYQRWAERHSWAFGNAYGPADDIRRVTRTDDVDALLPRVLSGFRDIVELKRPDRPVLSYEERGWYWSTETSKAIGQCHVYMDNLHQDAQDGLRGRRELVVYHPRSTIVIGRSQGWGADQYKALDGLNRRLNGITVMTFDQLLAQGHELLRVLSERRAADDAEAVAEAEAEEADFDPDPFERDPDDIPF